MNFSVRITFDWSFMVSEINIVKGNLKGTHAQNDKFIFILSPIWMRVTSIEYLNKIPVWIISTNVLLSFRRSDQAPFVFPR
jgi:hypothetical protein